MSKSRSLLLFTAMLSFSSLLLTSCGGSAEEFCIIARTSAEGRNETQINEYYEQLEATAPSEVKDDIAILRTGWKRMTFTSRDGTIDNLQRPPEVSEAALRVLAYVNEVCGFDGGIYLVLPERGF